MDNTQTQPGEVTIGGTGMSQPPEGAPSTAGMSSAEIAQLLQGQTQQGGTPPDPEAAKPPEPEAPQQKPEGEPQGVEIPKKFLNPDGTPNIENLAKSYSEIEKAYGRSQSAIKENDMLKQQVDYLNNVAQDLQKQYEDLSAGSGAKSRLDGKESTTEEEEEMIQNDPKRFVALEVNRILDQRDKAQSVELSKQRIGDYKKLTAINYAKQNFPGFDHLEGQVNEFLQQDWVGDDPAAVEGAYYAALGRSVPQMMASVKDESFKSGYEQAKKDMGVHVPNGSRGISPVASGNISEEQAQNMSASDLRKILPRADDGRLKVEY